jgi:hypothetical protein
MNSCVAQGLPVGRLTEDVSAGVTDEATGMRRLLTNHLKMMQEVMQLMGNNCRPVVVMAFVQKENSSETLLSYFSCCTC